MEEVWNQALMPRDNSKQSLKVRKVERHKRK